jgi:hypothetical protein
MAPVSGGCAMVVACGGEKAREAHNTPEFLEEQRERGERVTRVGKSTKNPRDCTIHHDGERFESTWLTVSGWGRCSPEAEGGQCTPVCLLGGVGEVARRVAVRSLTRW